MHLLLEGWTIVIRYYSADPKCCSESNDRDLKRRAYFSILTPCHHNRACRSQTADVLVLSRILEVEREAAFINFTHTHILFYFIFYISVLSEFTGITVVMILLEGVPIFAVVFLDQW